MGPVGEGPASTREGLAGGTAAGDAGGRPCRVEVLGEREEEGEKYCAGAARSVSV